MPKGWDWDESLYRGSATHYTRGRFPYAAGLATALAGRLPLGGCGRLLDVGCGPGVVALQLAHLFDEVIGVDPDTEMLEEAARRAALAGVTNARWIRSRAEVLSADLGPFRIATFGQSFHWMDRNNVAATVFGLLEPGGAFVHINESNAYVQARSADVAGLAVPPYDQFADLVTRYLGPIRRAGQGYLRFGTPGREEEVLLRAGFLAGERFVVAGSGRIERTVDDLVSWVFSRSDSAPHLFGDDLQAFESDLRDLLTTAAVDGRFSEQLPDTEVMIFWKPPAA